MPYPTGSAGEDMEICPIQGRASPSKARACRYFPLCDSKRLHDESNLIISFIITLMGIRWGSVRFVSDLGVCQAVTGVLSSARWLFYPRPYVYMKPCQQTEPKALEEIFCFFFGKAEIWGALCFSYQFAACLWAAFEWQNLLTENSAAAPVCLRKWAPWSQYNQLMQREIA